MPAVGLLLTATAVATWSWPWSAQHDHVHETPLASKVRRGTVGKRKYTNSTICSNRLRPQSNLDDLVSSSKSYVLKKERAEAVGYDKVRFEGNIGNDQGRLQHDYAFAYERLFNGMPVDLTMVNVGILEGHSLNTYATFFGPRATIVGTDISTRLWESHPSNPASIHVMEGDSTKADHWAKIGSRFPRIDLIIDDGCHHPNCVQSTLESAWPYLAGRPRWRASGSGSHQPALGTPPRGRSGGATPPGT